jgi:alpha-tubulin suppressor-like RCC1 family protein
VFSGWIPFYPVSPAFRRQDRSGPVKNPKSSFALAATLALLGVAPAAQAAPWVWAGGDNTCAIVNGAALCWGANGDGQVGNGTFTRATTPTQVQGLTSGVQAIVTSGAHSCAIVNGGAYCWGNNDYGQLGNNGGTDSPVPVAVSGLGSGVAAISVGDIHTCAVHNGAAKCWGSGGYGQLGTGASIFSSAVPVTVAGLGSGVLDVSTGKHHSCALLSGGAARCWGRGDAGEMGNNTTTYINQGPVAVSGFSAGSYVSAGAFFTCGIQNGAAQCWGYGAQGRLGTGNTNNALVPTAVTGLASGTGLVSAGNGLHACAISSSGPVCWGGNNAGQLGNPGVPGGSSAAVAVQGLPSGVVDITAGGLHSCAATETAIYCWGNNAEGQLGTGNQTASGTAVLVMNVPPPPVNTSRLVNISTRMQVLTGGDVMIGGFVIGGTGTKRVAIVATGPSLTAFGITNPLANPTLTLVRSADQAVLASNNDWQSAGNAAQLQAAGFAPSHPLEAAILVDLPPGAYTAIVQGSGGGTGVSVMGVYEVDRPEAPFVNISTRGKVLTGNDVMIGGFVIDGTGSKTVAIVATGPSLSAYGITSPLADPVVTLVRSSDQAVLAQNDDWQEAGNASQLQAAGFAPSNPLEAALLQTLQPGAYTVVVQGIANGTGVAVIGVYVVN